MGGIQLGRIQLFLLRALSATTVERYLAGLRSFNNELELRGLDWESMKESEQDMTLAEFIVDLSEQQRGYAEAATLLAAAKKVLPNRKFRTAWRCLEAW